MPAARCCCIIVCASLAHSPVTAPHRTAQPPAGADQHSMRYHSLRAKHGTATAQSQPKPQHRSAQPATGVYQRLDAAVSSTRRSPRLTNGRSRRTGLKRLVTAQHSTAQQLTGSTALHYTHSTAPTATALGPATNGNKTICAQHQCYSYCRKLFQLIDG